MNFDQARTEAILGARITAPTLGEGWFVDYQFNGLRIVSPNGSHSGFSPTDADYTAEWSMLDMEPPKLYATTKGGGKSWGLRPVDAAVGWGNPLPAVDVDDPELAPTGQRYAREPSNVGTPRLSGFELAQLEAKQSEPPKVDKWGQPVTPNNTVGKWGPGT